jgi:hypothetical protein
MLKTLHFSVLSYGPTGLTLRAGCLAERNDPGYVIANAPLAHVNTGQGGRGAQALH